MNSGPKTDSVLQSFRQLTFWGTALLIFVTFFAYSGQLPPDVNETHYLTKAKHFWDPSWCPDDLFLGSSFAHWMFFFLFGWVTKFVSLAWFAWLGRILSWAALAIAWQFLAQQLFRRPIFGFASAFLFLVLNDRFHLAGEWVVGGFEAKGIAYAFVILAMGFMVNHRWSFVWPLLGLGAVFHVLVGGWAFLAALFAWVIQCLFPSAFEQPASSRASTIFQQLLPMGLGILLIGVGALPPLLSDSASPPGTSAAASLIYVNQRISHHLIFGAFPTMHVARFVFLVAVMAAFSIWVDRNLLDGREQKRVLFGFAVGSLLIAFGGLVLSGLAEDPDFASQSASLLRFYWFRLSDFAVPLTVAISIFSIAENWMFEDHRISRKFIAILVSISVLAAGCTLVVDRYQDPRPLADQRSLPNYENDRDRTMGTYRNWRKVCQWISENTPEDAIFITPQQQQSFKWYAGRTEVVNWKDIPQDAESIVEWSRRVNKLLEPQKRHEQGLMAYTDDQIIGIAEIFKADYLLIPQREVDLAATPTKLKRVYPSEANQRSTYVVFQLRD